MSRAALHPDISHLLPARPVPDHGGSVGGLVQDKINRFGGSTGVTDFQRQGVSRISGVGEVSSVPIAADQGGDEENNGNPGPGPKIRRPPGFGRQSPPVKSENDHRGRSGHTRRKDSRALEAEDQAGAGAENGDFIPSGESTARAGGQAGQNGEESDHRRGESRIHICPVQLLDMDRRQSEEQTGGQRSFRRGPQA